MVSGQNIIALPDPKHSIKARNNIFPKNVSKKGLCPTSKKNVVFKQLWVKEATTKPNKKLCESHSSVRKVKGVIDQAQY